MPGLIQPERRVVWSEDGSRLLSVEVKSMFSGKWNMNAWQESQYIQTAMPQLSPEEREFLLTGATPEEWHAVFGKDDL